MRTRAPAWRAAAAMMLTAAYGPRRRGLYVGEILEARNVYTQGRSIRELRENLAEVVGLLMQHTPPADLFRFRRKHQVTPAGSPTERFVLVLR